jgi:DNA-binding response OmpR family regulator
MLRPRAPETILLIDDSSDELTMLADAMDSAGYAALKAECGEKGLDLARRQTPQLIVLDAVMPGLDGFETCRQLKADRDCAHIPVMFMTGLTETRHVLSALQAGGVDYVTKPVIITELLARMRVHIANSRMAMGARIGLDASGRHLLAVDRDGQILWLTPQAHAVLSAGFPGYDRDSSMRESLTQQFALLISPSARSGVLDTVHGASLSLEYLCESNPNDFLFRLAQFDGSDKQAMLRDRFGLTEREAQVLLRLTHGKSNTEIGEILLISPRTVNKHLEHIFIKLGVENRVAASSIAIQTLGALD